MSKPPPLPDPSGDTPWPLRMARITSRIQKKAMLRGVAYALRAHASPPKRRSDLGALRWHYTPTSPAKNRPDEIGRLYGYGHRVIIAAEPDLCGIHRLGLGFQIDTGQIGLPPRFAAPLLLDLPPLAYPTELQVLGEGERGRYPLAAWTPLPIVEALCEFLLGHVTHAVTRPTSTLEFALAVLRVHEARQAL